MLQVRCQNQGWGEVLGPIGLTRCANVEQGQEAWSAGSLQVGWAGRRYGLITIHLTSHFAMLLLSAFDFHTCSLVRRLIPETIDAIGASPVKPCSFDRALLPSFRCRVLERSYRKEAGTPLPAVWVLSYSHHHQHHCPHHRPSTDQSTIHRRIRFHAMHAIGLHFQRASSHSGMSSLHVISSDFSHFYQPHLIACHSTPSDSKR